MNADTLLENFEILAEAPGGISSLKNLILEMAIGGRLVAQIADEGDSGVLVDEIVSSREVRLKEKRLPIRQVPDVSDIQPSFEIPISWRWIRLGSVCYPQAGFAFKSSEFNTAGKGLPLIRIRDISTDHTQCHYSGEYRGEFVVHSGDWLIGMDGNFSIHKWLGPVALLNQRVTRLIFLNEHISKRFVAWSLQHQIALLMGTKSYTTVDHLSTKQINEALIPIPPLAEQARIVEKVDELMVLCDQLEQQQKQRDNLRTATRRSAINAISTATTPEELETAWKRINNNWEVIADTPESIESLKELILAKHLLGESSHKGAWKMRKFGDLGTCRLGKMLDKAKNVGTPRGYLRNANVQWFRIDISDISQMKVRADDVAEYSLQPGDLLICEGGEPGRCAIVGKEVEGLLFQKALHRFRPNPYTNSKFVAYWLMLASKNGLLASRFTGVTIRHLTGQVLKNLEIAVPDIAEQNEVVESIDRLMALCDQLESELKSRSEVAEKFARSVVNAA